MCNIQQIYVKNSFVIVNLIFIFLILATTSLYANEKKWTSTKVNQVSDKVLYDEIKKNGITKSVRAVVDGINLTISLRANFKDLKIIALSSDKESATKLKMAGANKVIPLVETTADIIANMLEKPISNKILHDILYNKSNLKIAQIKIGENSNFKDEQLSSIDWTRYNGIIVLSVVHEDMSSEFIYSSKANRHILQAGDMLVVVGYEEDIEFFEKKIGSERYVDWSHWSW